jgi:hypothetical protein
MRKTKVHCSHNRRSLKGPKYHWPPGKAGKALKAGYDCLFGACCNLVLTSVYLEQRGQTELAAKMKYYGDLLGAIMDNVNVTAGIDDPMLRPLMVGKLCSRQPCRHAATGHFFPEANSGSHKMAHSPDSRPPHIDVVPEAKRGIVL